MSIKRVSANHGWYWLIEGLTLWTRAPAFLCFLVFASLGENILLCSFPKIGALLASMAWPILALGIFNGCRAIDRKRPLRPGLLFSGVRGQTQTLDLLLAGIIFFLPTTLLLLSTYFVDGGVVWRLLQNGEWPEGELSATDTLYDFLIVVVLPAPLWAAYLVVPQLIGWWKLSVPDAILTGLRGMLHNWLPLSIYILCYFFINVVAVFVINAFNLTIEGAGILIAAVFIIVFIPVLFGSVYLAARDIFGLPRRRKHHHHAKLPGSRASGAEAASSGKSSSSHPARAKLPPTATPRSSSSRRIPPANNT